MNIEIKQGANNHVDVVEGRLYVIKYDGRERLVVAHGSVMIEIPTNTILIYSTHANQYKVREVKKLIAEL